MYCDNPNCDCKETIKRKGRKFSLRCLFSIHEWHLVENEYVCTRCYLHSSDLTWDGDLKWGGFY